MEVIVKKEDKQELIDFLRGSFARETIIFSDKPPFGKNFVSIEK